MSEPRTTFVQGCLARMQAGDDQAREQLLTAVADRFRQLCHQMLADFPKLRRWEETGDVFSGAMLRLNRALGSVQPESPRHFYRLAALQIRRELRDLARHHFGPQGIGANQTTNTRRTEGDDCDSASPEPTDDTHDPRKLGMWAELHAAAETLPDDQRETFDLIWYHQLTQGEAAELLGISRRTVIRRWQSACLMLHETVGQEILDA